MAQVGEKKEAISIYATLHPEMNREEIQRWFDMEEDERRYSAFELYCSVRRIVAGYSKDNAICEYLDMHPEVSELTRAPNLIGLLKRLKRNEIVRSTRMTYWTIPTLIDRSQSMIIIASV